MSDTSFLLLQLMRSFVSKDSLVEKEELERHVTWTNIVLHFLEHFSHHLSVLDEPKKHIVHKQTDDKVTKEDTLFLVLLTKWELVVVEDWKPFSR